MSFFKETDYHGSRAYAGDPPAHVDHFRLNLSLTFAWAKLQIEKFMRLGAPPQETSSLLSHGEKHFTLLGSKEQPLPAHRPLSEIFSLSESSGGPRGK